MQGVVLLEEAKADKGEAEERQHLGAASQWVAEVHTLENAGASARSARDTALDTSRMVILRLLQSIYHTLLAMQLLWAKSKKAPVFSPLELRHLARAMLTTLPVLAIGRANLPPGAQSNLCALLLSMLRSQDSPGKGMLDLAAATSRALDEPPGLHEPLTSCALQV